MKTFLIISAIMIFAVSGCSKENELRKSVFIEDQENPGLPLYSEWGYNTFGAYYDRDVFVSNDRVTPVKIIVSGNTMSFVLYGQRGSGYYYGNSGEMSMTFKISGFTPGSYSDLVVLNDSTLNLTGADIQVSVEENGTSDIAQILSGELNFKRAQNLLVDKVPIEVILSGYFEFRALIRDQPVTISSGRFDLGIGLENFYIYSKK